MSNVLVAATHRGYALGRMPTDAPDHGPGDHPPTPAEKQAGPVTAREAAVLVLTSGGQGLTIDTLAAAGRLPPREIDLTHTLVMGVHRHRLTLARLLAPRCRQGWKTVRTPLRAILLVAAYQLIWLDGVPAYAAVDEAVELAKRAHGRRAGAFVNAVLRQLQRDIEHRRLPTDRADPPRALPLGNGLSIQFRRPWIPDEERQPIEHLSVVTSHPTWLIARWLSAFGYERTRQICLAGACRPPLVLRPNILKTTAAELAGRLRCAGFQVTVSPEGAVVVYGRGSSPGDREGDDRSSRRTAPTDGLSESHPSMSPAGPHGGDKRWPEPPPPTELPGFVEGWFQVQDRTSQAVAVAMAPEAGMVVVDLCAGLGTKTTHLAELMGDQGLILATDRQEARLAKLRENSRRLGITCIRTVPLKKIAQEVAASERLDWILIDAPCSNTGVLARRPEARYRVRDATLHSLAEVQMHLLEQAASLSRPGGRIMYSTCSLEIEENEAVVNAFLRKYPQWNLTNNRRTLPHPDIPPGSYHDGGYLACLRLERPGRGS